MLELIRVVADGSKADHPTRRFWGITTQQSDDKSQNTRTATARGAKMRCAALPEEEEKLSARRCITGRRHANIQIFRY